MSSGSSSCGSSPCPRPGEIVHALERWEEAAGGGAVAAVQLAKLNGSAPFLHGARRRRARTPCAGRARGARRDGSRRRRRRAQRRAFTLRRRRRRAHDHRARREAAAVGGRRRSPVGGARALRRRLLRQRRDRRAPRGAPCPHPRRDLARAGDAEARRGGARRARRQRQRPGRALRAGRPRPAAASRRHHRRLAGRLDPSRRAVPRRAAPGPIEDAYGCGDCFAAGLTYGLATGASLEDAVALGARCGAAVLTGRGAYAGQLDAGALSRFDHIS